MKKLKGFNFKVLKEKFSSINSIAKNSINKLRGAKKNRIITNDQSFSYDRFYQAIFSEKSLPKIHKVFVISTLATTSYFAGRMIEKPIEKKLMPKSTRSHFFNAPNKIKQYDQIAANDLFKAVGTPELITTKVKNKSPESMICKTSTSKRSSLPITLLHTTVLQDEIKSVASVQVRGNKKFQSFRQGDKIKSMARIDLIEPLKIIVKNLKNGNCEKVSMKKKEKNFVSKLTVSKPSSKPKKYNGIENNGNSFKIKKSYRDKLLSNVSEVLTQARAIPIKNPDGTTCYKMVEVVTESIYTKLNIQNNDIICGINGKKFQNINQIMNLFGKIRDIDSFELSVKRNGDEKNFDYTFTD